MCIDRLDRQNSWRQFVGGRDDVACPTLHQGQCRVGRWDSMSAESKTTIGPHDLTGQPSADSSKGPSPQRRFSPPAKKQTRRSVQRPIAISIKTRGRNCATLPLGESPSKRRRGLLLAKEISRFSFEKKALPVGEPPNFPKGRVTFLILFA